MGVPVKVELSVKKELMMACWEGFVVSFGWVWQCEGEM
jgi:hypothetical protein